MQKYVIALYIRLSIEDYKYDSLSIENQSLVLHEYAASMPEALNAEIMEFIDNGYSGTNFERPQVQKLIELVRANQIDCIIVKDFSRFGRNSIETGYFIERKLKIFVVCLTYGCRRSWNRICSAPIDLRIFSCVCRKESGSNIPPVLGDGNM